MAMDREMGMSETERDLELEFTVRVNTFGKPSKITQDIGKRLAKATALALGDATVVSGDQVFRWSPGDHHG